MYILYHNFLIFSSKGFTSRNIKHRIAKAFFTKIYPRQLNDRCLNFRTLFSDFFQQFFDTDDATAAKTNNTIAFTDTGIITLIFYIVESNLSRTIEVIIILYENRFLSLSLSLKLTIILYHNFLKFSNEEVFVLELKIHKGNLSSYVPKN